MDNSEEQSLLFELKLICKRLGEAVAGMESDPGASREKIDAVNADLDALRMRMADPG